MAERNGIRKLASGHYQARYRFAPGPRGWRTATFESWAEARTWHRAQDAAARSGVGVDPRHGRVRVADYHADYVARRARPTTRAAYTSRWVNMLEPAFGALGLGDVTVATVEHWQTRMLGRYDLATVKAARDQLSAMMNDAVRNGMVAANRVRLAKAVAVPRKVIDAPDAELVAALFEAAPTHLVVALHLALGAGLRSGEVRGLTLDRVDFAGRELMIDRQLLAHPPGHVFAPGEWHHHREGFAPPKGGAGPVKVEQAVIDAIRTHLRLRSPGPQGLIVTARRGGPMGQGSWDNDWRTLCRRVGVTGVGLHVLRHAYATWSLDAEAAAGEHPRQALANVSRRLRHARNSTTLDMYVHADPQAEPAAILDRIARGPRVVTRLAAR